MTSERHVLLVGATKGLGLALAQTYLNEGWSITATTMEPSAGLDRLSAAHGDRLSVRHLDITDSAAVAALRGSLADQRLDVVHIVAGVFQQTYAPIWEQPDEEILRLLHTNAIGGVRLAERFESLVPAGGVFAFTSSGMGSMTRNDLGDVDLYRISKASLNMLVRSFAARHADGDRAVLLLCPGWAKTEMGGPDATVEIADSVGGMYAQVIQATADPAGARFVEYTGDPIGW